MKNIAVVLSGCGVQDGAEINEAVLTLLAIEQEGAKYTAFAPNIPQAEVVSHLSGEVVANESRNVLQESARLVRGAIADVTTAVASDFDALIFPGGFGAAKNLCNFAFKGTDMCVEHGVLSFARAMYQAKKPMGFMCIAPVLVSHICGPGVRVSIGTDTEVAAQIEKMGGQHVTCSVEDAIVDDYHKVVTTPAYMLADTISAAQLGITACVKKVIALI